MTDLGYGPDTTPRLTPTRAAIRWGIVAAVVVASTPAAGIAAFAAAVTWTGCFLSCSEPNHVGGALLGVLSLALLSAGPLLARVLLRTWRASAWTVAGMVAVAALFLLGLA